MSRTSARSEPYVFDSVPVDAVASVCAAVRQHWGDYGYSVATKGGFGGYLFGVRCADGSEWHLLADRWGNVWRADWNGYSFVKGEQL